MTTQLKTLSENPKTLDQLIQESWTLMPADLKASVPALQPGGGERSDRARKVLHALVQLDVVRP